MVLSVDPDHVTTLAKCGIECERVQGRQDRMTLRTWLLPAQVGAVHARLQIRKFHDWRLLSDDAIRQDTFHIPLRPATDLLSEKVLSSRSQRSLRPVYSVLYSSP